MAYKTANQLLADVYKVVGLVSGTSVNTYAEPNARAAIQQIFDFCFRKRYWDHLTDWHEFTVNGTTGLATTDLNSFLKAHEDIEEIWYADFSRRVVTPYNLDHRRVTGADAMYWTPIKFDGVTDGPFIKKVIQIWPKTATSTLAVRCRTKPDDFGTNDLVPFPSDIIANGAAWMMLDSDGINPTAASKAQSMFDLTYQDYVSTMGEDDIGHGGGRTNVPVTIRPL